MHMANPQMEHRPPHQSWGPQGFPPHAGGGPGFGHNPQYMPPLRQHDNCYPPAYLLPPMDKRPHHGISAYGSEAPMGIHASSNAQSAPSTVTQVIFPSHLWLNTMKFIFSCLEPIMRKALCCKAIFIFKP